VTSMRSILFFWGAASAASAASTVHQVFVGENGLLAYNPTEIFANAGDQLQFIFYPANHTVTQSSASSPCQPLAGGFFSGFVPTTNSTAATTFVVTVNSSTDSLYFYSSQGKECQHGMVGLVNPTNLTQTMYASLATNVTISTAPAGGPAGGLLETTAILSNGSTTTIVSTAIPTTASTGSATGATTSGGVVVGGTATTTAATSTSTGLAVGVTAVAGREALFGIGAGVAVGLLGGWGWGL